MAFYRRFPAAGPLPRTDFRWVLGGFFDDPESEVYFYTCHSFMCLFGTLSRAFGFRIITQVFVRATFEAGAAIGGGGGCPAASGAGCELDRCGVLL